MAGQRNLFAVEYLVKRRGRPWEAEVFASGREVATIGRGDDGSYLVKADGKERWVISRRIDDEVRPFSLTVREAGAVQSRRPAGRPPALLTIRNHVFEHHGRVYMLTNAPAGRPLREFLLGTRYICRLDNFPFSGLTEMDHGTRNNMRRYRGVPVGEMDGLGTEGHHVRLAEELEDIGLPLAAACYLLYSTA